MKKTFLINGEAVEVENLVMEPDRVSFTLNGQDYQLTGHVNGEGVLSLANHGHQLRGFVGSELKNGGHPVFLGGVEAQVATPRKGRKQGESSASDAPHTAPMPGKVLEVPVQAGEQVVAGQVLVVMEAMKLQLNIDAAYAGLVQEICFKAGDLVCDGDLLIKLEKNDAA